MSKVISVVTMLYGLDLVSLVLIMPYYPNQVVWFNDVSLNSDPGKTIETYEADQRWTSMFTIAAILTLTSLVLSYISVNQLTSQNTYHSRPYTTMGSIWFILMFVAASFVYTYTPAHLSPYQKSYFQLQNQNETCSLYYTNDSYPDCYPILPSYNVSNNRVCCLDIQAKYYKLYISDVGLLTIFSCMLYPVWLYICYVNATRLRLDTHYQVFV